MTENPENSSDHEQQNAPRNVEPQPTEAAAPGAGADSTQPVPPHTPAGPPTSHQAPPTAPTAPLGAPQAPAQPAAAHSASAYQAPHATYAPPAGNAPHPSIYDIPSASRPAPAGAAFGAAANPESKREKTGNRRVAVPVIAALAIGAVLGGASGAGIYALADNNDPRVVTQSGEAANITVNRADDATAITAVAAKASPSVVTLSVSSNEGAGTGSGIILSEDGFVLTNNHVVTLDGSTGEPQVSVTMSDGTIYPATVVGTDPVVDLAVVKLEGATGLSPIDWADSDELNVGDGVVAIGAPLGLSGTVTEGIISSLNRSITVASSEVPESQQDGSTGRGGEDAPYDFWNELPGQQQPQQQQSTGTISIPVVQTDAAINPGNSGGALLNGEGELIGVNVAIASAGGSSSASGSIGVGFAIPSNLAQRVADEIMADGSATHGLLGASVATSTDVDPDATVAGAAIEEVSDGGAAEQAGLQKGDVITQFNGVTISSSTDLTAQVRYLAAGAQADVVYVRDGESFEASVTLGTLNL